MVFQEILSLLSRIFETLLRMLGLQGQGQGQGSLPSNSLRVHVKYAGKTLQVDLDPSWTVARVKDEIAPLLKIQPKEIKIIFAGNELPDSFLLQSSDVGQQSYLHAVRVLKIQNKECDTSSGENGPQKNPEMIARRTRTFSKGSVAEDEEIRSLSPVPIQTEDSMAMSFEIVNDPATITVTKSSDFFVFCPECLDLEEGKLRVRCASCLSGALLVERPPESWDDVLLPSRIPGFCEEERGVVFSQFYFKCAKHVTKGEDDSAPPLPLVKRNGRTDGLPVPCLACGDVKDIVLVFPCPLSHVTCIDCFKQYALVKLQSREFTQDADIGYTIGCPALCENSFIKDPHHFKLLGKYQYDRYQRFGTEECLLQMGGLFCPQPDCGMGIIPFDSTCDKIACLHGCGYVFCRKCLEGWHIGSCGPGNSTHPPDDCSSSSGGYRSMGYYVSEDRAALAQWGDPTKRALRLSTKPCPSCRVPTERAGGCMHMECTKCKFEWCWVCQTKWSRDCMGNHWFG